MVSADTPSIFLPVGDWTARLSLGKTGKVALSYIDPSGKLRTRVTREVAGQHKRDIAAVRTRILDVERAIGEIRRRLEQTFRDGRDWSVGDWIARYQAQPLANTLASRLIWHFHPDDDARFEAMLTGEGLMTLDGRRLAMPVSGRVSLWRPEVDATDKAANWRQFCLDREIRQPFFQAWRPVYVLTEPELRTSVYSNRFAGLILDQPVMVRMLRNRGWRIHSRMLDCVPKNFAPARLSLPAVGLTAEYWGTGIGQVEEGHDYAAPNFPYFATTQIRFYRTEELGCLDRMPVPLVDVPPQAFSEAMFDIDLVSGIAMRGWLPDYRDAGVDAQPPPADRTASEAVFNPDLSGRTLDALGEIRRESLKWLLPRLTVGKQCRLEAHWLIVQGQWHEYAIHCGNAAVRIPASNRHICIVPAGSNRDGIDASFVLQMSGDDTLSLILSKATMLSNENRIKYHDIVRQLR